MNLTLFHLKINLIGLLVIMVLITITGCDSKSEPPISNTGKVVLQFSHEMDGEPIIYDDMRYINASGNHYLVNEIQYMVSDITLHHSDGSTLLLDAWEDIHYVDTDLPETFTYAFKDEIPEGDYTSISFTFGINESKNQSLMFVNPPESFMFWPENLGGGYHYMKLNGKWINDLDQVAPFNFHLGIGQIYYSYPDSITAFVQNYFTVNLLSSSFHIRTGEIVTIDVVMNVENWFQSPNIYNHNTWGGDIMQKQDAMAIVAENGWDVFSVKNTSNQ